MRPMSPFMFLPMMGPSPAFGGDGEHGFPENVVPARILVAMQYLSLIHQKEMKRAVAGDGMGMPMEVDGVPPTDEERITGVAACKMLSAYFNGELVYDPWEKQRHSAIQTRMEKQVSEGIVLPCPQCNHREGLPCKLCKGGGKVLLSPCVASDMPLVPSDDDSHSEK